MIGKLNKKTATKSCDYLLFNKFSFALEGVSYLRARISKKSKK
jgi:hypothetical protein